MRIPPWPVNNPLFSLFFSPSRLHRFLRLSTSIVFLSWPPLPVLGVLSHGRRQTVRRLGPPFLFFFRSTSHYLSSPDRDSSIPFLVEIPSPAFAIGHYYTISYSYTVGLAFCDLSHWFDLTQIPICTFLSSALSTIRLKTRLDGVAVSRDRTFLTTPNLLNFFALHNSQFLD